MRSVMFLLPADCGCQLRELSLVFGFCVCLMIFACFAVLCCFALSIGYCAFNTQYSAQSRKGPQSTRRTDRKSATQ